MNRRDILLGVAAAAPVTAADVSFAGAPKTPVTEPPAARRQHPMAAHLHELVDEFFAARDTFENRDYGLERAHAIAQQIELIMADQREQLAVGAPEGEWFAWLGHLAVLTSRRLMRECIAASRQPDGHYLYTQLLTVRSQARSVESVARQARQHADSEIQRLMGEEIASDPAA